MNKCVIYTVRLFRFLFAWVICFLPLNLLAQQQLDLGPLPGVGKVFEYLIPGTGQGFAGQAAYYMGEPAIFYDNVWVQRMGGIGSPGFRFLRAHEYAHHARGHVLRRFSAPPQMFSVLEYHDELEADCAAVDYLKRVGDLDAIEAGYEMYRLVLPRHDSGDRPGAVTRIRNMNEC